MIIDPVYEGKSMAGLIDLIPQRPDRRRPRLSCMRISAARPTL